jgi:hypothetical protein
MAMFELCTETVLWGKKMTNVNDMQKSVVTGIEARYTLSMLADRLRMTRYVMCQVRVEHSHIPSHSSPHERNLGYN